jgi:hypothetical protein
MIYRTLPAVVFFSIARIVSLTVRNERRRLITLSTNNVVKLPSNQVGVSIVDIDTPVNGIAGMPTLLTNDLIIANAVKGIMYH